MSALIVKVATAHDAMDPVMLIILTDEGERLRILARLEHAEVEKVEGGTYAITFVYQGTALQEVACT